MISFFVGFLVGLVIIGFRYISHNSKNPMTKAVADFWVIFLILFILKYTP